EGHSFCRSNHPEGPDFGDLAGRATVVPPVEQGDVEFTRFPFRADVILLIDRAHRERLPVWHKRDPSGCGRRGVPEVVS
ncbi:MAG: hypothetical protein WBL39_02705, partial [Terrimicrobiaceae bacterium]